MASTAIGSLAAVHTDTSGTPKDLTFDTGVIAIVLRTNNPDEIIQIAHSEAQLSDTAESVMSGRSAAVHEIGVVNALWSRRYDANRSHVNHNLFFRVTDQAGTPVAGTVFVEIYYEAV